MATKKKRENKAPANLREAIESMTEGEREAAMARIRERFGRKSDGEASSEQEPA